MNNPQELEKILIEAGYMGAFYGIRPQAQTVFAFFQMEHQPFARKAGAALGDALLFMGSGQWEKAAERLEKFLQQAEQGESDIPSEVKVFLALAYRKAQMRGDRAEALIQEVMTTKGEEVGAAQSAAQLLTKN